MVKLFGIKDSSGQVTALPGSSGATGDSSTVKDFIGKVYNVNKLSLTVEDIIAEGICLVLVSCPSCHQDFATNHVHPATNHVHPVTNHVHSIFQVDSPLSFWSKHTVHPLGMP